MQDGRAAAGVTQDSGAPTFPAFGQDKHLEYARLLRGVSLFAELDRVTLAKLAAHLQPITFQASSVIFHQGELGDAFYLVASGTVGVFRLDETRTTEVKVQDLRAGEPFGEMALLTNSPRTTTIRADTDCEVLRLERGAFLGLVREQPSVALAVAATLSRRLAGMLGSAGDEVASRIASVTGDGVVASAWRLWRPGRRGIAFAATAAILGAGLALSPPAGLSPQGWLALVMLIGALPILVVDAILEGVLALLLATSWVLVGVASAGDALAGYASASWVLVVSVLMIGAAITETGLLYRIALGTIARIRGGFAAEVCALSFAGLLMGPAVPNATSRVIIVSPMLKELVEALGYGLRSKPAAGLAMAVLIGFGQMAAMFLTSSATAVLVAALLPVRPEINWITWLVYGAPVNAVLFSGMLISIIWLYRPSDGPRRMSTERAESLRLQRALLGPMSRQEKIALGAGIGLLLGFVTQPLHQLHPGWVAVLAAGVLSAARVLNLGTLRAVNWNFALLFGILISLATVFERTGVDRWIADGVAAAMGDVSSVRPAFVVLLTLFCFAVSFVVRWQAAAPLITIALAPVAIAADISPFVVGLIAVIACNGFFLPYQSTTYLALQAGTGGKVFSNAQALPAAIAYGIWTMIAVVVSVPVWRLMGLL